MDPRPTIADLEVTTALPAFGYEIPTSISEILSVGGSMVGNSAITGYLTCPEKSRLRSIGVRPKRKVYYGDPNIPLDLDKDALTWGSIIHALRATRVAHGQDRALQLIQDLDLSAGDKIKLRSIWLTYDNVWPLEEETFKYLGVECEVITDIGDGKGGSLLRSVRYDSLIYVPDSSGALHLFSFECKSTSRSGENQFSQYMPQFMSQTMLWNMNPTLVARYGEMRGVLIDAVIKTEVPKCERVGPKYISRLMQQRAVEYMRLPESVHFPLGPEGGFARMLHACWGRYQPCEYIGLCMEDARGDYEQHGETVR